MTTIEKIARALYNSTPFRDCEGPYEAQSPEYRRMCEILAIAAVKAMRDAPFSVRVRTTFEFAELEWPKLIDSILTEAEEQAHG